MKSTASRAPIPDDPFPALQACVAEYFSAFAKGPFFTTDAEGLFDVFLAQLPEELRPTYDCHACKAFIERYGGLVTLDEDGYMCPVAWPFDAPEPFREAVTRMARKVTTAKVTGVFLSPDLVWGTPITGAWHHLAVIPARASVFHSTPLKTARQAMAAKLEERTALARGLADFPEATVRQAVALLESDAMGRSEKVLGVAQWLLALHHRRAATKLKALRENMVWHATATAPPGWCFVRSTMIGTLLTDLVDGLPVEAVARRFAEKMNPLVYMRPQAPPTAGNLAQAEKVVEVLMSAKALARRFATLDDVQKLWVPPEIEPQAKGKVFGHLAPQKDEPVDVPTNRITWEKFARDVLPGAEKIDYRVPPLGPFIALLTAADPTAPPILQWDDPEDRNPVSWYVYPGGSPAALWKLKAGKWVQVTAVSLFPHQWRGAGRHAHHGKGAIFFLEGCVDTTTPGSGLFPEILREEYHPIRASIEAYSRKAVPEGREASNACGVDLRPWNQTFRVTARGIRRSYLIDRWD